MSYWEKIAEYIGVEKILSFLEELIEFYFKPFKFFRNFFPRSRKDKIIQILIYSVLILTLGYVLISDISIRELVKAFIIEVAVLVKVCIILILSDFSITKIQRKPNNLENIIYFSVLAKVLLAPFQIVFFALFIFHENYNFFFIYNLIELVLFIYVFIFSAWIFNVRIRFILLNIVFTVIYLNLYVLITNKLSIDEYNAFESPYYSDQILKERLNQFNQLSENFSVPSYRILYKAQDKPTISHFVFGAPYDSVASGSFEISKLYQEKLLNNISILDTIIPKLSFERNKEYFSKSLLLYRAIDSLMNQEVVTYTNHDIKRLTVYMENDTIERYKEIVINIPNHISQINTELVSDQIELEKTSHYASIPLIITDYFFPIQFLINTK